MTRGKEEEDAEGEKPDDGRRGGGKGGGEEAGDERERGEQQYCSAQGVEWKRAAAGTIVGCCSAIVML